MAQLRWGIALVLLSVVLSGCEGTMAVLAGAAHGANEAAQADHEQRQEQQRYQRRMESQQYFYRSGNMVCDSATGHCQRVQ